MSILRLRSGATDLDWLASEPSRRRTAADTKPVLRAHGVGQGHGSLGSGELQSRGSGSTASWLDHHPRSYVHAEGASADQGDRRCVARGSSLRALAEGLQSTRLAATQRPLEGPILPRRSRQAARRGAPPPAATAATTGEQMPRADHRPDETATSVTPSPARHRTGILHARHRHRGSQAGEALERVRRTLPLSRLWRAAGPTRQVLRHLGARADCLS